MADLDDILLVQYNHLCEEIREYSKAMWQIPSFVAVANGFLISASSLYPHSLLGIFILFVALFLNITFFIAMQKHRFFEECAFSQRACFMKKFLKCKFK